MPTSPLHTAYRNPMRHIRADSAVRPYNRLPYLRLILALSFRASDRCHWRGNPQPRARRRGIPLPPSAREVARSAGRRDVDPPHPRCSSVGGDAHIAPYAAAAPRHQAKRDIPRPGAGYFCPRRQKYPKTPPKTTFLDFLTRLRPQLISLVLPRERCAVEISPKCCIASASLFAAAFALKCRAVQAWQEHFLNSGLWPPPTFAALRQRRDLIIA